MYFIIIENISMLSRNILLNDIRNYGKKPDFKFAPRDYRHSASPFVRRGILSKQHQFG